MASTTRRGLPGGADVADARVAEAGVGRRAVEPRVVPGAAAREGLADAARRRRRRGGRPGRRRGPAGPVGAVHPDVVVPSRSRPCRCRKFGAGAGRAASAVTSPGDAGVGAGAAATCGGGRRWLARLRPRPVSTGGARRQARVVLACGNLSSRGVGSRHAARLNERAEQNGGLPPSSCTARSASSAEAEVRCSRPDGQAGRSADRREPGEHARGRTTRSSESWRIVRVSPGAAEQTSWWATRPRTRRPCTRMPSTSRPRARRGRSRWRRAPGRAGLAPGGGDQLRRTTAVPEGASALSGGAARPPRPTRRTARPRGEPHHQQRADGEVRGDEDADLGAAASQRVRSQSVVVEAGGADDRVDAVVDAVLEVAITASGWVKSTRPAAPALEGPRSSPTSTCATSSRSGGLLDAAADLGPTLPRRPARPPDRLAHAANLAGDDVGRLAGGHGEAADPSADQVGRRSDGPAAQ
jgi:hypothetical protein